MYALVARLIKHRVFTDYNQIKEISLEDFFNGLSICDWMDYVDGLSNNAYNS